MTTLSHPYPQPAARVPRVLLVHVAATCAAAAGLVAWLALRSPTPPPLSTCALAALAFACGLRPVVLPGLHMSLTVTHGLVTAAIALTGPLGAIAVDVAAMLGWRASHRRRRRARTRTDQLVFNLASATLSSGTAGLLYARLEGALGAVPRFAAAALLYFVVSSLLGAAAIAFDRGAGFRQVWTRLTRCSALPFSAEATSGLVLVGFYAASPVWALLALAPVALLSHRYSRSQS